MANVQLVDVDIAIQNLFECQIQGQNHGSQLPPAISMVPRLYRDQNPSCFDPQVISIGPLHRANKNVQEGQGLKATYMHNLLARLDSPPKQILEVCLLKVLSSLEKIKVWYAVGTIKYDDFELANMMVINACFILEFLQKRWEGREICPGNRFVISHIMPDLVLLENQIPFFVLQDIFNCTLLKYVPGASLVTLVLEQLLYYVKPIEAKPLTDQNHSYDKYYYKHILDILHKGYQPPTCVTPSPLLSIPISHSVVELNTAGVNFKPNRDENWSLALEYESLGLLFFRWSTLGMPVLCIHDSTELIFRNLIAYEQSCRHGYYFTSFACAMDMLVSSTDDVIKLIKSKVIVNYLSNESAAYLFNDICNRVFFEEFFYQSEWQKLDEYYNSYWPKNIARLRRTYFNNPWNMIALVAVILLFALTVIQTWFTVKSASTI